MTSATCNSAGLTAVAGGMTLYRRRWQAPRHIGRQKAEPPPSLPRYRGGITGQCCQTRACPTKDLTQSSVSPGLPTATTRGQGGPAARRWSTTGSGSYLRRSRRSGWAAMAPPTNGWAAMAPPKVKPLEARAPKGFKVNPGDGLSSQAVTHQVLSLLIRFTAVFGMGTGGTISPDHREIHRTRKWFPTLSTTAR